MDSIYLWDVEAILFYEWLVMIHASFRIIQLKLFIHDQKRKEVQRIPLRVKITG